MCSFSSLISSPFTRLLSVSRHHYNKAVSTSTSTSTSTLTPTLTKKVYISIYSLSSVAARSALSLSTWPHPFGCVLAPSPAWSTLPPLSPRPRRFRADTASRTGRKSTLPWGWCGAWRGGLQRWWGHPPSAWTRGLAARIYMCVCNLCVFVCEYVYVDEYVYVSMWVC